MTTPKSTKPSFGSFVAPEAAKVEVIDRARYAGLPPKQAADLIMEDFHAKRILEPSTKRNKTVVLCKILRDLAQRGLDMATVDTKSITEYRAFLRAQIQSEILSENYCHNLSKDWNSVQNLLMGQGDQRPGTDGCLKMKVFRQTAKQGDHLTIEDMEAMLSHLPELGMQNAHYRNAVGLFLEVAMSSAGRWDSIGSPKTTFQQVDFHRGIINFPKVKNKESHEALVTDRALRAIAEQRAFLIKAGTWQGEDKTPLLMGPRGAVVTYKTVNEGLHKLAELAGLRKRVTTHVPRKSVGTHMARDNPRLAREQLGITAKIFEKHYNQPTIDDRMARRDLLPGVNVSKSPAERIGSLYIDLKRGKISQQEFDDELRRGLLSEAVKPPTKDNDLGYG